MTSESGTTIHNVTSSKGNNGPGTGRIPGNSVSNADMALNRYHRTNDASHGNTTPMMATSLLMMAAKA